MFAFFPLFVDFVRYLTSGTTRFKYRFSRISHKVRWLDFLCSICLYGLDQAFIPSVEGIWLDVPLTRSLAIPHNFFATARDNLCSLLDSGRQIFHWSKLTMLSPWVQPWVRGGARAPFPNSGWQSSLPQLLNIQKLSQRSNRPFYSCRFSDLASEWQWGWRWPCFDTDLYAFLVQIKLLLTSSHLHEKSREVCIKARSPPASLAFRAG